MSSEGTVYIAPAGGKWVEVGHISEDGLVTEPRDLATVKIQPDGVTARAWARVGPGGVLSLDAPLVEVDPVALLDAVEASIGRQVPNGQP